MRTKENTQLSAVCKLFFLAFDEHEHLDNVAFDLTISRAAST